MKESIVQHYLPKLCLTGKQFARWAGKRDLVLIEVTNMEEIPSFTIDKRNFENMDDWLPVGNIEAIRG